MTLKTYFLKMRRGGIYRGLKEVSAVNHIHGEKHLDDTNAMCIYVKAQDEEEAVAEAEKIRWKILNDSKGKWGKDTVK